MNPSQSMKIFRIPGKFLQCFMPWAQRVPPYKRSNSTVGLTYCKCQRLWTAAKAVSFGSASSHVRLTCSQRKDEQWTLQENEALVSMKAAVQKQGAEVQRLEAAQAPEAELKEAAARFRSLMKALEDQTLRQEGTHTLDRQKMLHLATSRMYFDMSYEPYGGVAGLYDFGPLGAGLLDNLVREWELHFVLRDSMLRLRSPALTPESVLRASGHVAQFCDLVVKDAVTGQAHRLDHLVERHLRASLAASTASEADKDRISGLLSRLDGLNGEELWAVVKEHQMTAPSTGNPLTPPQEFNLMYPVGGGSSGRGNFYLRPETSQAAFLNLPRLLQAAQHSLPLAVAQVGPAFRNEVSPQQHLLRLRQFTLAEIEHFCDPGDTRHPKFSQVRDVRLHLCSRSHQLSGAAGDVMTIGEALEQGLVDNETLGYYMARIQQYLLRVGVSGPKLRFRQHLHNEMAHYASDCWDAECLTSYGWVECVGCADRSAYDLKCHAAATGVRLAVERPLAVPKPVTVILPQVDKAVMGKAFKKDAKAVQDTLMGLSPQQVEDLDKALQADGKGLIPGTSYEVTRQMVPSVKTETKMVHVEEVVPNVVEPSFGIGRIFYSILEHTFTVREDDDKRTYFAVPCVVAPVKVAVLPLSAKPEFEPFTQRIVSELTAAGVSVRVDGSTGSIGRRYARADEASVPFAVTVDFDTLAAVPATVTLRERDSTQQLRVPVDDVAAVATQLATGRLTWQQAAQQWPSFTQQEVTK